MNICEPITATTFMKAKTIGDSKRDRLKHSDNKRLM